MRVILPFADFDVAPHNIRIVGNLLLDTIHGFEFSRIRGARFESNLVRNTLVEPAVSLPRRERSVEVSIMRNRFERLAMHTGRGIRVHPTDGIRIDGNPFIDCGWLGAPGGAALTLEGPPDAGRLVERNVFEAGPRFARSALATPGAPSDIERALREAGNRIGRRVKAVESPP